MTAIRNEYFKQRRRIQNLASSYRRKGYDVQFEIPTIPKRITAASVRRLKKITVETIRQRTFGIDYETGEQISYYKAQLQLRKLRAAERSAQKILTERQVERLKASTVIINSFRYLISKYPPSAFLLASRWLDAQIRENGEEEVSRMLQRGSDAGLWIEPREAYKAENVKMMINGMMDFIGLDMQEKQVFMDSIDEEFSTWEDF